MCFRRTQLSSPSWPGCLASSIPTFYDWLWPTMAAILSVPSLSHGNQRVVASILLPQNLTNAHRLNKTANPSSRRTSHDFVPDPSHRGGRQVHKMTLKTHSLVSSSPDAKPRMTTAISPQKRIRSPNIICRGDKKRDFVTSNVSHKQIITHHGISGHLRSAKDQLDRFTEAQLRSNGQFQKSPIILHENKAQW